MGIAEIGQCHGLGLIADRLTPFDVIISNTSNGIQSNSSLLVFTSFGNSLASSGYQLLLMSIIYLMLCHYLVKYGGARPFDGRIGSGPWHNRSGGCGVRRSERYFWGFDFVILCFLYVFSRKWARKWGNEEKKRENNRFWFFGFGSFLII